MGIIEDCTVYDVETYPNAFTVCFKPVETPLGAFFEISDRRNDAASIFYYLTNVKRMVGFNNFNFDWPIIDHLLNILAHETNVTALQLYEKAQSIIDAIDNSHIRWKPVIPQIDLYLIHHFDNRMKSTSLKMIEFNMRSRTIADLPYPPGTMLRPEDIDVVLNYNGHDTLETERFLHHSRAAIEYRESLGEEWINYNDAKIGKQYFIRELEKAGVSCYHPGYGKQPRQTRRPDGVPLASVILPHTNFVRPELQQCLEFLRSTVIHDTKGSLETTVDLDGFKIHLGLGGIHGSVTRQYITGQTIMDFDVTGYYPSIAIEHGLYPEHLGPKFVEVFRALREQRKTTPRENVNKYGTLKLAQNAVFGDSNNPYSVFLDPAYMLATTVNGQLSLCMFVEQLSLIPGVRIIQVNTDGVTIQFPDRARPDVEAVHEWWQAITRMDLEAAIYSRMFIRDVNNYLAVSDRGKIKRKGVYDYEMLSGSIGGQIAWNRNFSALVIPRAAEAAMLNDVCPEDFIRNHDDPWDFLLRTKVPRSSRLELGDGTRLQNITRYYISETGKPLVKIMPPLRGKNVERRIGVHAEGLASPIGRTGSYLCSSCGEPFRTLEAFNMHNKAVHCWLVEPCNTFDGDLTGIDFRYYFQETEKLLIG